MMLSAISFAGSHAILAQGKGGGGKGRQTGPRDGSGKQAQPKDHKKGPPGGAGKQGRKTGPRDGSGPIHTPGTGKQ
jgi:hypothetical protein